MLLADVNFTNKESVVGHEFAEQIRTYSQEILGFRQFAEVVEYQVVYLDDKVRPTSHFRYHITD